MALNCASATSPTAHIIVRAHFTKDFVLFEVNFLQSHHQWVFKAKFPAACATETIVKTERYAVCGSKTGRSRGCKEWLLHLGIKSKESQSHALVFCTKPPKLIYFLYSFLGDYCLSNQIVNFINNCWTTVHTFLLFFIVRCSCMWRMLRNYKCRLCAVVRAFN